MPAAKFARGVHQHLISTVNEHIAEYIFEIDPRESFTTATRYDSIDALITAVEALPPVPPVADEPVAEEPVTAGFQQVVDENFNILRQQMQQVMERLSRLENRGASTSSNV